MAVTRLSRNFAENLAALGKIGASSFCARWQNLCKKIFNMADIDDIIQGGGLVFKRGGGDGRDKNDKVKTKAKKKKYVTGSHGSGSARQKAKYREQRANRQK